MSPLLVYIRNKRNEYEEHYEDPSIDKFSGFYSDILESDISAIFSILHYELNKKFEFLNYRLSNGHYNAEPSRGFIYLINEISDLENNLKGTTFEFSYDEVYKSRMKECLKWLSSSGGSSIPEGFPRTQIIEIRPIFNLKSVVGIDSGISSIPYPAKSIGEGSYANVLKFKDTFYNKTFAVKMAKSNLVPKEVERFRREFSVMKELRSPYVIEVYGFNYEKNYYIMEWADETLEKHISVNNDKLSVEERLYLARQIFKAFIYINGKEKLHRDISTTNILIKKYDDLKIIKVSDFGLVKEPQSSLTSINTELKGSFNDPKLELFGFQNYNIKHEIYALTRLIYFVMTGKRNIESFYSPEFDLFISNGLSDDLTRRYDSVKEMKEMFDAAVKVNAS